MLLSSQFFAKNGLIPLNHALINGHINVMELLLKAGADKELTDDVSRCIPQKSIHYLICPF
jgi:hypothetical protein